MAKKGRPSKVPVSQKDMFKIVHRSIHQVFTALGMTLRDFQGDHGEMLTNEDVRLIWEKTQDRALRLIKGKDSLEEYDKVLKEEYDIEWSNET